jgi:hypothetical protein
MGSVARAKVRKKTGKSDSSDAGGGARIFVRFRHIPPFGARAPDDLEKMQPDQQALISEFIFERLRAGDDLLDGVELRAKELLRLPARPTWSDSANFERAKEAWSEKPLTARRDETGEDWAQTLKKLPRPRGVVEPARLADFRLRRGRRFRVPVLSLIDAPVEEITVVGIGDGEFPRPGKPGIPRGRAAGVAALRMYWNAASHLMSILPPDLSWIAVESVRLFLVNRLTSRGLEGMSEEAVTRELRKDRERTGDDNAAAAERVFAAHARREEPDARDLALLFAYPSARYRAIFADVVKPNELADRARSSGVPMTADQIVEHERRRALYDAYGRGGAFGQIRRRRPEADAAPPPSPAELIEAPPRPRTEGDREMDVPLNSRTPIVFQASALAVPRSSYSVRAGLIFDGDRVLETEERPASASRNFSWMRRPKGGVYVMHVEALDEHGRVIARGASGELRVHQFAHCARCPERVDFSEPNVERTCRWKASPNVGTLPTTVESDDFSFLARYGDNERVRRAADVASRGGRVGGRLVVPGEPAACAIEYLGVHSPDRQLPDYPRLTDAHDFVPGSLVAEFEVEMLELEARAADLALDLIEREKAVESLVLRLKGETADDSRENAVKRLRRQVELIMARATQVGDRATIAMKEMDALVGETVAETEAKPEPESEHFAEMYRTRVAWLRLKEELADEPAPAIDGMSEEELEALIRRTPEMRALLNRGWRDNNSVNDRVMTIVTGILEPRDAMIRIFERVERYPELANERQTLARAIAHYREIDQNLDQYAQDIELEKRRELELLRAHIATIGERERAAMARLERLRARNRELTAAQAWAREAAALAGMMAIGAPVAFEEQLKDYVARHGPRLSDREVEEVEKILGQIIDGYATDRRVVAERRDTAQRLIDRAPPDADEELLRNLRRRLERTIRIEDELDRLSTEARRFSERWNIDVGAYADSSARVVHNRKLAATVMAEMGSAETLKSDRYYEIRDDLVLSAADLQIELDDAARARETAMATARRVNAELPLVPESPISGFDDLRERSDRQRAEFEARRTEAERDREREERERIERAMESSLQFFEQTAAAAEQLKNDIEERRTRKAPLTISALVTMEAALAEVSDAYGSIELPQGVSETETILKPLEKRLEALEEIRASDSWAAALAAGIVAMRNSNYWQFGRFKNPESLRKAMRERLTEIAAVRTVAEKTAGTTESQTTRSYATEMTELFDRVTLEGRRAESRLIVLAKARELIENVNEAIAALARDANVKDEEDVARAVDLANEIFERRVAVSGAIEEKALELLEMEGEHDREFEPTETKKSMKLADPVANAHSAHADYSIVAKSENEKVWAAIRAKLLAASPSEALDQLDRLIEVDFADKDEIKIAIEEQRDKGLAELAARISEIPVPTNEELEANRGAAVVAFEMIGAIRDDMDKMPKSERFSARGKELDQSLTDKEIEVRNTLTPARDAAIGVMHRARVMAQYGGDDDEKAFAAFEFLRRENEMYGYDLRSRSADALRRELENARGVDSKLKLAQRCSLAAYVPFSGATCALDAVVMIAGKADPEMMGRLLTPKDDCAKSISAVLRQIDEAFQKGMTPSTKCDVLRRKLFECEKDKSDDTLSQLLFAPPPRSGGRTVGRRQARAELDVMDLMSWLNRKYDIELSQMIVSERTAPDPLESEVRPHDTVVEREWPYVFGAEKFDGLEFFDQVPVVAVTGTPRVFAIASEAGEVQGSGTVFGQLARRADSPVRARFEFDRWNAIYRLAAIVHWSPGHYWLTFRCKDGNWFSYNALQKPQLRAVPQRNVLATDVELKTMRVLVYVRETTVESVGVLYV